MQSIRFLKYEIWRALIVVVLSFQHDVSTRFIVIIFFCTSQDGAPENKQSNSWATV